MLLIHLLTYLGHSHTSLRLIFQKKKKNESQMSAK